MAEKADTNISYQYKWEIPFQSNCDSNCVEELTSDSEEEEKDKAIVESSLSSDCFNSDVYLTDWPGTRKASMLGKNTASEFEETEYCKVLYWQMYAAQSDLFRKSPVQITFNIEDLSRPWKMAFEKGIQNIELAAPGLHFELTASPSANIYVAMADDVTKTIGSLRFPKSEEGHKVKICVTENYSSARRAGTALHELLHALGFEHENERYDSGHYLKMYSYDHPNMKRRKFFKPHTPFDQYSVMFYKIGHYFNIKGDKGESYSENKHMSELDKIALNMLHPPCEVPDYKPVKSRHGMYYCGRFDVMRNHNQPYPALVDQCGPLNGPNCAACRVLSKPNNLGKRWQGRSNYVYCGNDCCGPHVDTPCDDCLELVGEQHY